MKTVQYHKIDLPHQFETDCWIDRPLEEVIAHIENHFHKRLRKQLPEFIEAALLLEQTYEDQSLFPVGISLFLKDFSNNLFLHLNREEILIFPMIVNGQIKKSKMSLESLVNDDEGLEMELAYLRVVTLDFTPAEDACEKWIEFYKNLEQLEAELLEHVHLENEILFPRALQGK